MGNALKNRRRQAQIREYAEPRGLYPQCAWDRRLVRREVLAGKLAPCFPGQEGGGNPDTIGLQERERDQTEFGDLEECPICLLFYPGGLNRMICCKQSMCTECYLQVKLPPQTSTTLNPRCPFCKSDKFDHLYTGPLTADQKRAQEIEQQKVLELQIKMQSDQRKLDVERQQQRKLEKATPGQDGKEGKSQARSTSTSLSSTPEAETGPSSSDELESDLQTGSDMSSPATGQHPQIGNNGEDMTELEQLMLEEALRQSLLESKAGNNHPLPQESLPVEEKMHVPVMDHDHSAHIPQDEDEDVVEDGDDLNHAILLSLSLSSSSSASSSSTVSSLP